MINLRKAKDRGQSRTDWLESYHTFSFADYYDPAHHNFGNLRVINEDFVNAGKGFATHPHKDMEIITYVIQGVIEHKDSMGNGSLIHPGEIQRMSAGTGIRHSEFNHEQDQALHLLQIWITPSKTGIEPSYEQKKIVKKADQLILIGSEKGNEHGVTIHQDVNVYAAYLTPKASIDHVIKANRNLWVQLVKGVIQVNSQVLHAGDGAALTQESKLQITCDQEAELLVFDLK